MKSLIYTLIAMFLLFLGLQQMSLSTNTAQNVFIMSWLALALFVVGGNLVHYLYRNKKGTKRSKVQNIQRIKQKKKQNMTLH
ncbi:hypothetical protein [Metabacillus fastidiosus]|uniref:hypothetical protein n=1 Tax=Metabacillus fastidiosus TaxID=1458 RepID=UPI002DB90D98|nr:hypothetical protein [Metabacillus fastidiosus]MEC2077696.1 hypothetical protein [Metabacillus fastidiosus]